ncbi:MmgE/PrpD family protein [Paracoccus sp. NSM]|uniref:MmgE/PrpD family protein n=1 Tax=Paracoccus sp. NSM TaxID=3457784 RepID=UPI004035B4D4
MTERVMELGMSGQDDPAGFLVDLALMPERRLPRDMLALARLSLLDWLVCGLAGRAEPLADKMRHFAQTEAQGGSASLFGGSTAPARLAAMVNGAISHALDYDDTHFDHVGHLSVGILPAALALAEERDQSAAEICAAFLLGAEGAIRLGRVLGAAHYNRGFHQTATAGAFGAALAAGRLAGLNAQGMRRALGLCATRASGLKSQFGTMGKPLNAGLAAANGVEAVQLAALGLTTAADGIFGPQGFVETHSDAPDPAALRADPQDFRFRENRYKFHACCHGLHAMIEGLRAACPTPPDPGQIARIEVRTAPRWLRVCDIKRPGTGLEVKFSYGWLAAMVLTGRDTGDDRSYTDALALDPALADLAARVEVGGDHDLTDQQVRGEIVLTNGHRIAFDHDLSQAIPASILRARLQAKARALLGAGAGPVLDLWGRLDGDPASVRACEIGALIRAGGG